MTDRAHNPPDSAMDPAQFWRVWNFEDTDPKNLETAAHDVIVTAFAAAHCMEESLWYHADRHGAMDDPNINPVRERVMERLEALGNLYHRRFGDRVLSVWINGNPSDDAPLGNYEVEDDIRKALGTDGITYDSESGWFNMYCTEARRPEVEEYIARHHPYMEVSYDQNEDDVKPPMLGSWTVAREWLVERNMTTVIDLPAPTPKGGKELEALLETARTALRHTGLSLDEATKLL